MSRGTGSKSPLSSLLIPCLGPAPGWVWIPGLSLTLPGPRGSQRSSPDPLCSQHKLTQGLSRGAPPALCPGKGSPPPSPVPSPPPHSSEAPRHLPPMSPSPRPLPALPGLRLTPSTLAREHPKAGHTLTVTPSLRLALLRCPQSPSGGPPGPRQLHGSADTPRTPPEGGKPPQLCPEPRPLLWVLPTGRERLCRGGRFGPTPGHPLCAPHRPAPRPCRVSPDQQPWVRGPREDSPATSSAPRRAAAGPSPPTPGLRVSGPRPLQ